MNYDGTSMHSMLNFNFKTMELSIRVSNRFEHTNITFSNVMFF